MYRFHPQVQGVIHSGVGREPVAIHQLTVSNERWPDLDVETEVKVWRDWLTDDDLEDRQFTQIAEMITNGNARDVRPSKM